MKPIRISLWLALCTALALPASAQVLYKLIDKNGKVTYAEKPPKDFDGKVIRMDIDPNANTAVLPKPGAAPATGAGEGGDRNIESLRRNAQKKSRDEERLEKARSRVDDAKQRLQDLIDNPSDNDIVRMGKVGGGTRPAFTEEYQARIASAEAAVKEAEEELARVQAGR